MKSTNKLVISALLLSLCLVLPFFTGQIPEIGNMLLPMHFPVFIAGFVVGGPYAMIVGITAPLLRSMLWGMPILFPKALGMAFELAAYGLISGLIFSKSKKDTKSIFTALIAAMLGGRTVWGVVTYIMFGILGNPFTLSIFMTEAFVNSVLGITVQLIFIPLIISALKKSGTIKQ